MTPHETAVRIWPVLVAAAHNRQTLTRERVVELTGIPGSELGPALGDLERCCARNGWPPLPALVLGPAAGPAVDADRQQVFQHRWFRLPPLTVAVLEEAERPAKRPCPRCGKAGNAGATLCGYCWARLTPPAREGAAPGPDAPPPAPLPTAALASTGSGGPAAARRARAVEQFDEGGEA